MAKTLGSLELMKRMNRSLILEAIKHGSPISRSQIAKELELSKTTVSSLVEELLERKLVVELGDAQSGSSGGRKAKMLGFNFKSKYGIGVDIGGTKILIIITDWIGNIVFRKKIKTTSDVQKIFNEVKNVIQEAKINTEDILAIGMGVPGTADVEKGFIYGSAILDWNNLPLKKLAEDFFSIPVFINNDVNCAALGERWLGSGDNYNDIFFIAIGTGVGSAIITNGSLVYGHDFRAGEIGYQISEEDLNKGLRNESGKHGIFEKKISGSALMMKSGYPTDELFNKYLKGEETATSIINNFTRDLAIVIVNSVNLLNPRKVIIGGGVSESMEVVLQELKEKVNNWTPFKTEVALAILGGDAGALGAVAFALREIEESNLI